MKTAAFGVSALAIVTFVFVALLQLVTIDTRAVSLQDTLQTAMSASLETALDARAYTVNDEDELVADVVQGVILALDDPRAELDIQVNAVDRTLGLVSMKVTAHYPSVTTGDARDGSSVSVERTVILEHAYNETGPGSHRVVFTSASGEIVKSYTLAAGSQALPYPTYEPGGSATFEGWALGATQYSDTEAGKAALRGLSLDRDYEFTAVEG